MESALMGISYIKTSWNIFNQKSGIFYDVNGMSLPNGSLPSAHIPLNQFDITKMP